MKVGDKVKVVANWYSNHSEGVLTEIVDSKLPYTVSFTSYTNPPVDYCYFSEDELEIIHED